MKKYFTGFVIALVFLGMSGVPVSAQTVNANQIVELFISLGIISANQAGTARSAVGSSSTGNASIITPAQTPSGVSIDPFAKKPSVKITAVCKSAGCNEPNPIAGQSVYVSWNTKDVAGPGETGGGGETFSFKLIKANAIERARQNISLVSASDIIDLGRIGTHFGQATLFIPSTVPTGSYYMYVGDWSFSEAKIREYVQGIYNTKNGSRANPIDYSYDISVVTQAYLSLHDFNGPFTIGNGSGSDGQGDFTARISGGNTKLKSGFGENVTVTFSYDPYFISPGTRGSAYGGLKGDEFTVVPVLRPAYGTPVSEFSSYYNKNVGVFWFPSGTGRGFNGRGTMYLTMQPDLAPGAYDLELQFQASSYSVSQQGITQPFRTVLVARVTVEAGQDYQFIKPEITSFVVSPTTVSLGSTMVWTGRAKAGSSSIKQHRAYVLGGLGSEQTGWSSVYGQNASLDVSVRVDNGYVSSDNGFGNRGSGTYTIRYEVEDVMGNISFEDKTVTYNGPVSASSGNGSLGISPADSINTVWSEYASVSIGGPASFTTQDNLVRWPLYASIINSSSLQESFSIKGYITSSSGVKISGTDVSASTALSGGGNITNNSFGGINVVAFPVSNFTQGRYIIVAEVYKGSGTDKILLTRNTKSINFTSTGGITSPTIISHTVNPTSVIQGKSFTWSGSATKGTYPITRYRAYVEGSSGGLWTQASNNTNVSFSQIVPTNTNPGSFYKGTGVYTLIFEAEDSIGQTTNAKTPLTVTTTSGGGAIVIPATGVTGGNVDTTTPSTYIPTPRRCVGNCGNVVTSPTTGSIIIDAIPANPTQSVVTPNMPSSSAQAASCPLTLTSDRGLNGTKKTCYCASVGSSLVWGSNPYTDDSAICVAAKHAGLSVPGNITYTITPGQSTYTGSTQNGITSQNYGSWGGSFTISR